MNVRDYSIQLFNLKIKILKKKIIILRKINIHCQIICLVSFLLYFDIFIYKKWSV